MGNMPNNLESLLAPGTAAEAALFRLSGEGMVRNRPNHTPRLAPGTGHSIAQYGEVVQGQIEEASSLRKRRFLVSLPCNVLYSRVTITPTTDGALTVNPPHKKKVKTVADLTLRHLGYDGISGSCTVESNIEEGKGCGSS